jgi:hypothetical protein
LRKSQAALLFPEFNFERLKLCDNPQVGPRVAALAQFELLIAPDRFLSP